MTEAPAPVRVTVVVTAGCHLCESACSVVDEVCAKLAVAWQVAELSSYDQAQQTQWGDWVPVVLVDEAVHDIFRVDPARLAAALSQ